MCRGDGDTKFNLFQYIAYLFYFPLTSLFRRIQEEELHAIRVDSHQSARGK